MSITDSELSNDELMNQSSISHVTYTVFPPRVCLSLPENPSLVFHRPVSRFKNDTVELRINVTRRDLSDVKVGFVLRNFRDLGPKFA